MPLAAEAAEFDISVPEPAAGQQVREAIENARRHRETQPADTIVIHLPEHIRLTEPIVLTAADSGRPDAPLVIRGSAAGGTIVNGAVILQATGIAGIEPPPPPHLPRENASEIRQASLAGQWDLLSPHFQPKDSQKELPHSKLFVFRGDQRLQPARWPASGYATKPEVKDAGEPGQVALRLPAEAGDLGGETDLWIAAYWHWNWWFEATPATKVTDRAIRFAKPENEITDTARYYIFNAAAALTDSGFYYLDTPNKRLFYRQENDDTSDGIEVAVAPSLLQMKNVADVRVEAVAFEKSVGPGVSIENSRDVTLTDCFVGHTGGEGIQIDGGQRVTVDRCVIDDTGYSGIFVSGGDPQTLTPANHRISHTKITRFGSEMPTYRPGVRIFGVGQTVEDCEIARGPHAGIIFSGNNHTITGNIIHDVAMNSDDAGAIYAGRDWASRGTVISGNYVFDVTNLIGTSALRGVYLDDQLSGTIVTGNIFQNVDEPILVGGGRDNVIKANLFLSEHSPIRVDSRGTDWEAYMVGPGGVLRLGLDQVPYQSPVYTSQYPGLATVLTDRPGSAINNAITDNISLAFPVVVYDPPANASLGVDKGNSRISAGIAEFPAVLRDIPADAPARGSLVATAARIDQTRAVLKTLKFADKAPNPRSR